MSYTRREPRTTQPAGAATQRCAVLAYADLSDANLDSAQAVGVEAPSASLTRVTARGADFSKANLCRVSAISADLAGAKLEAATLVGADLSSSLAELATFKHADLMLAELPHIMWGASLEHANLVLSRGWYSDWLGVNLRGVKLTASRLEAIHWPDALEGPHSIGDARLVSAKSTALATESERVREVRKEQLEARARSLEAEGSENSRELASKLRAIVERLNSSPNSVRTEEKEQVDEARQQWAKLLKAWDRQNDSEYLVARRRFIKGLAGLRLDVLELIVRNDTGGVWGGEFFSADQLAQEKAMQGLQDSRRAEQAYSEMNWQWGYTTVGGYSALRLTGDDFRRLLEWHSLMGDATCSSGVRLRKEGPARWCELTGLLRESMAAIDVKEQGELPKPDPMCSATTK